MSSKDSRKFVISCLLFCAVLLGSLFLLFSTAMSQTQYDFDYRGDFDPPTGVFLDLENTMVLVVVPDTATIFTGEYQQYRAYFSRDGGNTLDEDITELSMWSVDDPAIGEVMATKGLYRGIAPGQTTVRATRRLAGQAELIVQTPPVEVRVWLEVTPQTATIEAGESQQYRAYLKSTDGSLDREVTDDSIWDLADNIATATAKGRYRGDREGSSALTATYIFQPQGGGAPVTLSDDARLIVTKRVDTPPDDTPDGETPPTEDLPEGKMLDRQPGYITLSEPQNLGSPGAEFTMAYDQVRMDLNPDRYPKIFYWNEPYQKWVALASYPLSPGSVRAANDGDYTGWFVVFGCIQPRFTDITPAQAWAETTANRMNGLGLLEGYPNPDNPSSLIRPAGLERTITRAELTAMVARILGLAPGETHLYPTLTYMSPAENDVVLQASYADAALIAPWARPYIAAMTKARLVRGKGNSFAGQDQMTRIEAAVLISDALRNVPGFGYPADLTVFTDYDQIPAWAVGEVAEGTVSGYPDGSLRPNLPISRAEAMTLLLRLLRGLGW